MAKMMRAAAMTRKMIAIVVHSMVVIVPSSVTVRMEVINLCYNTQELVICRCKITVMNTICESFHIITESYFLVLDNIYQINFLYSCGALTCLSGGHAAVGHNACECLLVAC